MLFFVLKYLHLIGAAVLLGTGAGIAFFMLMAQRARNVVVTAAVAIFCLLRQPLLLSRSQASRLLLREVIP